MEKCIKLFVFVYLIGLLMNPNLYANKSSNKDDLEMRIVNVDFNVNRLVSTFANTVNKGVLKNYGISITSLCAATSPPTVTSPIYYCQNKVANPLTATPSAGGTLNWYGTNAAGGTASSTAPIPSTVTVGTTSYYVSETVGGTESARSKIDVVVVADTNDSIQFINCTYPAPNSIYFDWANILNHPSNAYNYSYSIQGGALVFGNANNSSVTVSGVLPGQSVTLTVTSVVGFPCIPTSSKTCSVPCGASTVTPNFPAIAPFCTGTTAPSLSTTSPNGITGTWSPSIVSNTASGSYVFTPNPVSFPCATTQTLVVTVKPMVTPSFTTIPATICQNAIPPNLPTSSNNSPSIVGTWSPAVINTAILGSTDYTFTPNAGQCALPKTINITIVNPANTLVKVEWTVTQAFAENQVVTITATAPGDYVYQLDDGPFQESPVFEYVSYGTHMITVKDKFGCNTPITKSNVLVINYPKYFTPNSDGINDTWNIFTLDYLSNSRIFIFDRYGKLLKEISTKSLGWDGMYNGHPMPSNDYWFSVEYVENDISKIFKSHFSLKR